MNNEKIYGIFEEIRGKWFFLPNEPLAAWVEATDLPKDKRYTWEEATRKIDYLRARSIDDGRSVQVVDLREYDERRKMWHAAFDSVLEGKEDEVVNAFSPLRLEAIRTANKALADSGKLPFNQLKRAW